MDDLPPEPLNDAEIEIAQQNIDEMYPLKNTPLMDLFPYLCCFLRYFQSKPYLRDPSQRGQFFGIQSEQTEFNTLTMEESFKVYDDRLKKVIKMSSDKEYEGTDFIQDSIAKFTHN